MLIYVTAAALALVWLIISYLMWATITMWSNNYLDSVRHHKQIAIKWPLTIFAPILCIAALIQLMVKCWAVTLTIGLIVWGIYLIV